MTLEQTSHPLVSVILPVYNGEKTVLSTIDSLISQDYPSIEIIVIDDNSKDKSKEVISSSPHYSKLSFSENETNLGISKTYNLGIKKAKGEFILFLHHDCTLGDTSYIKKAVTTLTEDEKIGVITGKPTLKDPQQLPLIEKMYAVLNFMDVLPPPNQDIEDTTFVEFKADMIRRSILDKLGLFTENITHSGEDQDISTKLRDHGYRVVQHNGMPFILNFGGNQDSFEKLLRKQADLSKSQAYILWTHKSQSVQNMTTNRRLRAFHRGFQIGFSALVLLLIFLVIGAYIKSLLWTLLLALVLFRFGFYMYYTIQYGYGKYALLFPFVGFLCDIAYGVSFFYGLFLTIYRGRF